MKILEIKSDDFSTGSASSLRAGSKSNVLNNFLRENRVSFLQSLKWGEFLRAAGQEVKNLIIEENGEIIGAVQVIKRPLVLGKFYWYGPRGPILNLKSKISNLEEIFKLLVEYLQKLDKNTVFLRIDLPWLITENEKINLLKKVGFKKSLHELQPKDTLILDITKSEEELLKEMHQKTRYNIRLAEKKGVNVRQSTAPEDLEKFYKLLETTAQRDKFFLHRKEYYQKQLEILGKTGIEQLFLAEYQGKTIAGILVLLRLPENPAIYCGDEGQSIQGGGAATSRKKAAQIPRSSTAGSALFFGDTAIYLHGASDNEFRSLMAPHLLQWTAILEAKKRGYKFYDFWGIAPTNAPEKHPWAGVTRFKRGFGGKEINYLGAYDFVFNKFWYFLYNLRH